MTKAIIVIDMPSSCEECSLSKLYGSYCCVMQSDTWATNGEISSDCPLKQMPEKRENIEGFDDIDLEWQADSYCDGWNACIDEILGEENW